MNDYFSNLGFNKLQQKQTLYKKVEKIQQILFAELLNSTL